MEDLIYKPVTELAALLRDRQVTAVEVVETHLRHIEAVDPSINAFVEVSAEEALEEARAHDAARDRAPFGGIPIAVKSNVPVKGRLLTMGTRMLAEHRASHDAYLVERLRQAGFVIVGMTNLPELGILPTTEPLLHGPTRNPWDLGRTPGGSSGGSAAAVAAGMVPIAHGNDGGGSIRIPAACTGLVGLKPNRGRVSRGPELGDSFLTADGVLTRTVTDTAIGMDVLGGYEVGDATWAPRPIEPYSLSIRREPGTLRVGFSAANALEVEADPECARGMREAAELLASLGHDVFEAKLQLPPPETLHLFMACFGPWISLGAAYAQLVTQREPGEDDLEPLSRALVDLSKGMTATDFLVNQARLQALARAFVAQFADFDLLLTPSLAERPLPIGECTGYGADPLADFERSGRFTPYAAMLNVTGQPAINVPVCFGDDGLPTCVQMVGPPLGEDTLLQVASQMESARPWAQRTPDPQGSAAPH